MGGSSGKIKKNYHQVVLGLDGAGKTTILKNAGGESLERVSPTHGFNIKYLAMEGGYEQHVWDIGGQESLRPYWVNYIDNTDGVIFVIDSADEKRIEENGNELQGLLEEENLKGVPFLVLANKLDLMHSIGSEEIMELLSLDEIEDRPWTIVACSGKTGEGIDMGFEWLVKQIDQIKMTAKDKKKKN